MQAIAIDDGTLDTQVLTGPLREVLEVAQCVAVSGYEIVIDTG
jgi:hypothetical protein